MRAMGAMGAMRAMRENVSKGKKEKEKKKKSMSTDRLIARLMPKGNQLPRWREGKYPGHE